MEGNLAERVKAVQRESPIVNNPPTPKVELLRKRGKITLKTVFNITIRPDQPTKAARKIFFIRVFHWFSSGVFYQPSFVSFRKDRIHWKQERQIKIWKLSFSTERHELDLSPIDLGCCSTKIGTWLVVVGLESITLRRNNCWISYIQVSCSAVLENL